MAIGTVSIITPWRNHPELIPEYERTVCADDAEVIVIDNGSYSKAAQALRRMVRRLDGQYVRNEENRWFSAAANQGLAAALGDVVVFLNNDVSGPPEWIELVRRDVTEGGIFGPSYCRVLYGGLRLGYIEGWCIAARRSVWEALGGFDERAYPMPYWEDTDLCFRATRMGYRLARTRWPLVHKGHVTSREEPGVQESFDRNREVFLTRVAKSLKLERPPENVTVEAG